jgi:hypothetical protein
MMPDLSSLTTLPWHWEWVPRPIDDEPARRQWSDHVVSLFEDWTRGGWDQARAAWPATAPAEFPFTPEVIGRNAAEWLLQRADSLPRWARLAWGAAFVAGRPRWAPVPVVVEFREPRAEDPNYLMDVVGASKPRPDDGREPTVDYVTTPFGDGVRVVALGRSAEGAAFGRLDAALRLDWPPTTERAGLRADVLLATRVFDVELLAVIGPGVEQLMRLVATEGRGPIPTATAVPVFPEEVTR